MIYFKACLFVVCIYDCCDACLAFTDLLYALSSLHCKIFHQQFFFYHLTSGRYLLPAHTAVTIFCLCLSSSSPSLFLSLAFPLSLSVITITYQWGWSRVFRCTTHSVQQRALSLCLWLLLFSRSAHSRVFFLIVSESILFDLFYFGVILFVIVGIMCSRLQPFSIVT